MTPETWIRIKDILAAALCLPEAEREAFLLAQCHGDMRAEVDDLLKHQRTSFSAASTGPSAMTAEDGNRRNAVLLIPGARLGPYEIVSPIGRGGMGAVYRAHDGRLGRIVALKVVSGVGVDQNLLQRFEQEARATAALNHPNIVTIHDVGTYHGQPYIVSELLEGQTLRSMLGRGALSPHSAVKWFIDICRGLSAAHRLGIIHRDLKPENLFITKNGTLKILDFGLAKLTEKSPVAMVTAAADESVPGVILGTVGYLSPEQITGGSVDQRSDIFALGIILHEMITRQNPFAAENAIETMHAILKRSPSPIATKGDPVLTLVNKVIDRCLKVDPDQRFSSAEEILSVRGTRVVVASTALSHDDGPPSEASQEDSDGALISSESRWIRWVVYPLILAVGVPVALVTLFAMLGIVAFVGASLDTLYHRYTGYEANGCLGLGTQLGSFSLYNPSTFKTLRMGSTRASVDLRAYVDTRVSFRYRFDPESGVAYVTDIQRIGPACTP